MEILSSLSRLGGDLINAVEVRIQLFAAELELDRLRLVRVIILSFIGASALGTAVLAVATMIVLAAEPHNRIEVLSYMAAVLLIAGGLCLYVALRMVRQSRGAFTATRAALKKDQEWLVSLSKN